MAKGRPELQSQMIVSCPQGQAVSEDLCILKACIGNLQLRNIHLTMVQINDSTEKSNLQPILEVTTAVPPPQLHDQNVSA